jgi:hypothetical protein
VKSDNLVGRLAAKRRPPGRLTRIGDVINESTSEGYLGLAREMVRVFEVWEDAVGAFNAARTFPESIKNGRLTVWVESPVWIDRFSYLKQQFIKKINEKLGVDLVEEIVFKAGRIKPEQSPVPTEKNEEMQPMRRPAACPVVVGAVSVVEDEELRACLESFLRRQTVHRREST